MELVHAIDACLDHYNQHPKPFIWTASATDILEKASAPAGLLLTFNLSDADH
jgi:hypothetical protein